MAVKGLSSKHGENVEENKRKKDYLQEVEAFEWLVAMKTNALDLMLCLGAVHRRICNESAVN